MAKTIKVLIADDHTVVRSGIAAILSYESDLTVVGEASNGEEALKVLETVTPDLVTLDITMPVMDGLETLNNIKEKYPSLKVIMISAAGQKNKVIQALKDGALDFIRKPFEKDEMLEVIGKHL